MKAELINLPGRERGWAQLVLHFGDGESPAPQAGEKFTLTVRKFPEETFLQPPGAPGGDRWPAGGSECWLSPNEEAWDGRALRLTLGPDFTGAIGHGLRVFHLRGSGGSDFPNLRLPTNGLALPLKSGTGVSIGVPRPQAPPAVGGDGGSGRSLPAEEPKPADPAPPESLPVETPPPAPEEKPAVEPAPPAPEPTPPAPAAGKSGGNSLLIVVLLLLLLALSAAATWYFLLREKPEPTPPAETPQAQEPQTPPPDQAETPEAPAAEAAPPNPLEEARRLLREGSPTETLAKALSEYDGQSGAEDAAFLLAKALASRGAEYRTRYGAFFDPSDERPSGSIAKNALTAYQEYEQAAKNGDQKAAAARDRLLRWAEKEAPKGEPQAQELLKISKEGQK